MTRMPEPLDLPEGVPAEHAERYRRTVEAIMRRERRALVEGRCPTKGCLRLAVYETAWGALCVSRMEVVGLQPLDDRERSAEELKRAARGGRLYVFGFVTADTASDVQVGCRCGMGAYTSAQLREAAETARAGATTVVLR